MRCRVAALLVTALVATACASAPLRPVRSEFEDVPVPRGLTYIEGHSIIVESSAVKSARLVYRGRLEVTSLAATVRATLQASGWRQVSATAAATQGGYIQVYEKAGHALQARLWEGVWFTYLEYLVGVSLASPPAAPSGTAPPAYRPPGR